MIGLYHLDKSNGGMEAFFALLVVCAGNPVVTDGFPSQKPVVRGFDDFVIISWIMFSVNNELSHYLSHYNAFVMDEWKTFESIVFRTRVGIARYVSFRSHACHNQQLWSDIKRYSTVTVEDRGVEHGTESYNGMTFGTWQLCNIEYKFLPTNANQGLFLIDKDNTCLSLEAYDASRFYVG